MKKVWFLIPLVLGLSACSSNQSVSKDESELAPGVMQPVSGSGAEEGSYSWTSEVESAPMPASMTK
ncbi:hypothetical protein NYR77_07240 [Actinobacillus equuli subsp. haemolyticus]|uniref:hypothetical protein n=1 Tax=Actinobacillus equuli TaxID=718 RepID=UPI000F6E7779|nr:hypothetical protein [Actinobacillus equuli]MDG4952926.1 hypothetical protein [Actinobacillus equuli subsp. equuli]WGE48055.1 hypothetical protein NYR67_07165 [Actinobacillus equuli subsp. equuli]WGE50146.1 hypothetical protein NYR68_07675 [Actinobacillus equuli subsp. haemolyticus]WGE56524.1 hypothetical protein NYR71_07280 [Actinobacillus equuli subsp. equuli]WGE66783.1 hypothetical protein NYR77_07240 [Actinobacillus equuli subsp. haemolyticus]